MKHKKENCTVYHMIIGNNCGLVCVNCGVCKCTPEQDLAEANRKVQKKHKYFCGLVEKPSELSNSRFFFESPDGQNGELYNELRKLGYTTAGYNAEYYWKVKKGDYIISFTEGDIDITSNKSNE